MTIKRFTGQSRGRWRVTDANGRVSIWDMDNCTWKGESGGPWRIIRGVNYPMVGAIFEVEVEDPTREWTMPPKVLVSSNVVSIEYATGVGGALRDGKLTYLDVFEDLPPARVSALVLDGDLVQDEPFLIVPEPTVYRTLCDGTAKAITFTTTTDGEQVRFYVNPTAAEPNTMATRLWAALNPVAAQRLYGTVVVMGTVEGFDYHVPESVVQAAKGLSP